MSKEVDISESLSSPHSPIPWDETAYDAIMLSLKNKKQGPEFDENGETIYEVTCPSEPGQEDHPIATHPEMLPQDSILAIQHSDAYDVVTIWQHPQFALETQLVEFTNDFAQAQQPPIAA